MGNKVGFLRGDSGGAYYHYGGAAPGGAINIMRGTPFGVPVVIGGDRGEALIKFRMGGFKILKLA